MIPNYNFYAFFPVVPFLPPNCDKPPTIYQILNSIVNGDKEDEDDYAKIKDLAKEGRGVIFNFNYPLSDHITKEHFETMILNKFLMRRIGYDTVTAFRIQLNVRLNEIMPLYNKMFDALDNWQIFADKETTYRQGVDNTDTANESNTSNTLRNTSTTTNQNISDRRHSDTPQNELQEVRDGDYVTNYAYDTDNSTSTDNSNSNGTSENTNEGNTRRNYNETIEKSLTNMEKIAILKEMQENIQNIFTMIFNDLEILFYQLL